MATFKITDALIEQIQQLIEEKKNKELTTLLSDLHYADIAEVIHISFVLLMLRKLQMY